MATATDINEYDAISKVIQHHIDGARSGKGALIKPAFHDDATIFDYVGPDLFAGSILGLYHWNDANGSATGIVSRVANIDLVGTVASVRLESDNWIGHRFTDFFNLLKVYRQ